jgi:hypothetical protein
MSDIEPMPISQPAPMPAEADMFAAVMERNKAEEHRRGVFGAVAIGLGVAAAGATIFLGATHNDAKFAQDVTFNQAAQTAVEKVSDVMADVGTAALPAAMLLIGAAKLRKNEKWKAMDSLSTTELTNGDASYSGTFGKIAKKAPFVTVAAAATGALMAGSVTDEISNGPSRPIDKIMGALTPGKNLIAQDQDVMPMVESYLKPELTTAIEEEARRRGVAAHPFSMNLGSARLGGRVIHSLSIGTETAPNSPLHWSGQGPVPVFADKAGRLAIGTKMTMNGIPITVVGHTEGASAIDRIGFLMDSKAMKARLEQNANAPDYGVSIDADKTTSDEIRKAAQAQVPDAVSATISTEQFKKNSKDFWDKNAKPLTSVIALSAVGLAIVAMGGSMKSRLTRNRAAWASHMANGVTSNQLRSVELLRSLKEGVGASLIGVAITPVGAAAVNMLGAGLKTGLQFRDAAIGSCIGIVGALVGGGLQLTKGKLSKIVNVSRDTRV